MNINFSDPILLICTGVIIIGIVYLVWAIGKWRQLSTVAETSESLEPNETGSPETVSLPALDLDLPKAEKPEPEYTPAPAPTKPSVIIPTSAPNTAFSSPATASSAAPAPVNKEVADRLEMMGQRLAEMQALLNKQLQATPATIGAPPSGMMGQGFSPESIDKLLKIIGNVVQQVEILQRSIVVSGAGTPPATPAGAQAPMSTIIPAGAKPAANPSPIIPGSAPPTGPVPPAPGMGATPGRPTGLPPTTPPKA
jgi:hypothetical protein